MTVPWGLLGLLGTAAAIAFALVLLLAARRLRHPPRRTAGWALARGRPVDPGELDLAFREDRTAGTPFWIAARDEETLASERSPTVVILHGWGRSRRDTLARLEPWRRLGFRMAIPDLRGHGDAEGPSTLGTAEVGDLIALLESLPGKEIHLCGHSMGGVLAIHVAADLAGGDRSIDTDTRTEIEPASRRPRLAGIVALSPYERVRIPAIAQLEAEGIRASGFASPLCAVLRLSGVRERSTREAAERLRVPLLVMHGGSDRLCPIADAERIAAAAGSLGTFTRIDRGGHDDRSPETLRSIEQAIETWLDEVVSDRSST